MTCLRPVKTGLKYDHVIGTGGIGSGIFFSMNGDHTLGRNESRMATLLPYKDFCKLHIVMHYLSVFLGAKVDGDFQTFPIGKVGNDDIGRNLVSQMKEAGMRTKDILVSGGDSTLFSVCFQYPDNTGGNITTENSASSSVSVENITSFFQDFKLSGEREIILAVPEVPLSARIKLLEYGRQRGSFNAASILSSEVEEFRKMNGFGMTDIISVNIDEASGIAKTGRSAPIKKIIDGCVKSVIDMNPSISLIITDGPNGSYCCTKNYIEHTPVPDVKVLSTAGAGDTFLAGTLAGLCCGLPLTKGKGDLKFSGSPLQSAVELGTLLASLAVTSHDTIHQGADADSLFGFVKGNNFRLGKDFLMLFANCYQ